MQKINQKSIDLPACPPVLRKWLKIRYCWVKTFLADHIFPEDNILKYFRWENTVKLQQTPEQLK